MNALCGISSELVYGKLPHSLPRILSLSRHFPNSSNALNYLWGQCEWIRKYINSIDILFSNLEETSHISHSTAFVVT